MAPHMSQVHTTELYLLTLLVVRNNQPLCTEVFRSSLNVWTGKNRPAGWVRTDTNVVQKVQILVRIDWMSVGTKWLDSWPAGLRLGNSPCSTPGLSQLRRSTHQGAHKTARCAKKVRTGSVRKGNSCLLFRERKDSLVLDRCIQYWNNTGTRLNIYFGWQV